MTEIIFCEACVFFLKVTRPFLMALLALAVCASSFAAPAAAETHVVPANQVMVSSVTGNALVIWDASNFVQTAARGKESKAQVIANVRTVAGKLLIEKARTFSSSAKTVTVRVLYAPTVLAELYKTATFDGFEKLMTVTASRGEAAAKSSTWLKLLSAGKIPAGMTVVVLGSLPAAWN